MFDTVQSQAKYHGKAFSVRQDQVQMPNGRVSKLDIVEHSGAVTMLPLDADQNIWFVRQYRHPTGEKLLELPAGTLDAGEAPQVCAQRELQEEIGMAAEEITLLGEFFLAPGYSTEYMYVYLATGLTHSVLPGDDDEFIHVEKIQLSEVWQMALRGELRDAKTLAALLLAQPHLP